MSTTEIADAAPPSRRAGWMAAGFACLTTGTVGIVVPLLPTVDFYVLAAWCFSKGDPRVERWLMAHPRIGPIVREWQTTRGLPVKVKCLSSASLGLTALWSAHALKPLSATLVCLGCCAIAAYLWTRPGASRRLPSSQRGSTDVVA